MGKLTIKVVMHEPKPEDFGAACSTCGSNCGQCGITGKYQRYIDALTDWHKRRGRELPKPTGSILDAVLSRW
jgi:hypothetical protein